MSKQIFNNTFLDKIKTFLAEKCDDGSCVTRKQLCEALDIDSALDGTIGSIIKLGYVDGFRIWMGPNGGIGRTDLRPPKKKRSTTAYTPKVTDEFKALLRIELDKLCVAGVYVSRKEVAEAMGDPGTKAENLISAAIKMDEFADFATKHGKGGGVYRVVHSTADVKCEPEVELSSDNLLTPPLDVIPEDGTLVEEEMPSTRRWA